MKLLPSESFIVVEVLPPESHYKNVHYQEAEHQHVPLEHLSACIYEFMLRYDETKNRSCDHNKKI